MKGGKKGAKKGALQHVSGDQLFPSRRADYSHPTESSNIAYIVRKIEKTSLVITFRAVHDSPISFWT